MSVGYCLSKRKLSPPSHSSPFIIVIITATTCPQSLILLAKDYLTIEYWIAYLKVWTLDLLKHLLNYTDILTIKLTHLYLLCNFRSYISLNILASVFRYQKSLANIRATVCPSQRVYLIKYGLSQLRQLGIWLKFWGHQWKLKQTYSGILKQEQNLLASKGIDNDLCIIARFSQSFEHPCMIKQIFFIFLEWTYIYLLTLPLTQILVKAYKDWQMFDMPSKKMAIMGTALPDQ